MIRLLLAALLMQAALALPDGLSLELPLLLVGLSLAGRWLRLPVLVLLVVLAVQKLADLAMMHTLGRRFDVVVDLPLVDAGLRLIAGSFGRVAALACVLAALLALAAIILAARWATAQWSRTARLVPRLGLALLLAAVLLPLAQPRALNLQFVAAHLSGSAQTLAALRDLRARAAQDAMSGRSDLLAGIDREVLVIFVESYGRASFDVPLYADRHLATLGRAQAALTQAGLAMRSGFLSSPTQGGQSWLAHATFASGLRIADQASHRALLASPRRGLFHHAQAAGFRTAAVMPGITRPWPEAARMGFDRVLAAADLGYCGPPFNWVTMPDQFTLAAADRLLGPGDRQRLFAQIVLISSHAPWTPVPRLIDWADIGCGTVFADMATAGPSPREVWRDRRTVREYYRDTLDYALQTVAAYALRHADAAPLLIVLGDHQAAPDIALDDRPQVPLHIIGPAALVDQTAAWGLTPGLIPPRTQPAIPMERMRDLILTGFRPHPA